MSERRRLVVQRLAGEGAVRAQACGAAAHYIELAKKMLVAAGEYEGTDQVPPEVALPTAAMIQAEMLGKKE